MAWLKTRTNDDGTIRYTGMYRDIRGRERSAGTFDSKRTAKRAAQRFENDVRGGRISDPKKGRQTLRQYVETQWLPNHVMEETTRESYVYVINRHVLPYLGGTRMIDLLPGHVRDWVSELVANDVHPPTIRSAKICLGAILTTALNEEVVFLHAGRGVKIPTVARKPRTVMTAEHYQTLYEALGDDTMRLLAETDIETGLRWGELSELRPRDINFATSEIIVSRVVIHLKAATNVGDRYRVKEYPKDGEWRVILIADHLTTKLRAHIAEHGMSPDDLLFPLPDVTGPARRRRPAVLPDPLTLGFTEPNDKGRTYRHGTLTAYQAGRCRCQPCKDGVATYRAERRAAGKDNPRTPRITATDDERHMSNDWFRANIWEKALTKANLGFRVTPHGLRHAHASWLLAGGADLQVVKERLGHGSISTTERYLHTLPNAGQAALAALNNIRTPSPEPSTTDPTGVPAEPAPAHDGSTTERLATVTALPIPATNPADVLQGMDPDLVRKVLAGLLQQVQSPAPTQADGSA